MKNILIPVFGVLLFTACACLLLGTLSFAEEVEATLPKETPIPVFVPVFDVHDPGIFRGNGREIFEYTPSQYELDLEKRITALEEEVQKLHSLFRR